MTTKKAVSAVSAPSARDLSAPSAPFISTAEAQALLSAVFYDAEKGTFLRGSHVLEAFRAHGVSVDAFRAWCAERWLQRVDTSYAHAVRLAASVVYDFCDPYEIADTFCDFETCTIEDAEKHAVKVTADDLYKAGDAASAVYEFIADQYGEQEDGDKTVKLVQLMDEMRIFIKARTLQKRMVK